MMKLVHGRSRCLQIVGASAKFAGTTKRCRVRPSFGELVRPSRHDEVVLVQTTNLVCPPGDRHLAPLGQQCRVVPLLLGLLACSVGESQRLGKVTEPEHALQAFDALSAVQNQDIPMIMGTVLFASLLIVAANLVIDLLYPLLDPRITYS
jgi:hypothetical protein